MGKRTTILLIGILLTTLPVLAVFKSDSYRLGKTADFEKCSDEIEKLKLCVENSKIAVNSGEPVRIRLFWVNTSDVERRIGRSLTGYDVTVIDENGKKLTPVYEQKYQKYLERQKQMRESGEEDKGIILRAWSGSDRGFYAEANGIRKDEIRLTEKMYDYDLSAKGKYYVRIAMSTSSITGNKSIEFVLDNIEIQVK